MLSGFENSIDEEALGRVHECKEQLLHCAAGWTEDAQQNRDLLLRLLNRLGMRGLLTLLRLQVRCHYDETSV